MLSSCVKQIRKRTRYAIFAFGMVYLLGASATNSAAQGFPTGWLMYQARPDHNAVFSGESLSVSWERSFRGKINGGLAVVDGVIYASSFDRHVYALDAKSGSIVWSRELANISMSAPLVYGSTVYVGTGTNAVLQDNAFGITWGRPAGDAIVAVDAKNGGLRWQYSTVGEDMPTPILDVSGTVPQLIFSNGDNHVRSVNADTGQLVWVQPMLGVSTMSSLAARDGVVYGASNFGLGYINKYSKSQRLIDRRSRTWAIRASDGQYIWMLDYGNSDCSPTVGGGMVFMASDTREFPLSSNATSYNTIYGINAASGAVVWKYRSKSGQWSGTGSNEEAIAGVYNTGTFYDSLPFAREVVAFDGLSGRIFWRVKTVGPVKMSPVVDRGKMYFGDTSGWLYVVRLSDGAILRTKKFPSIL
mgnify:CR=1 FL=1